MQSKSKRVEKRNMTYAQTRWLVLFPLHIISYTGDNTQYISCKGGSTKVKTGLECDQWKFS